MMLALSGDRVGADFCCGFVFGGVHVLSVLCWVTDSVAGTTDIIVSSLAAGVIVSTPHEMIQ